MLSVTDSALERLRDAMDKTEDSESCFRMIVRDDNTMGLILQRPATGDKTFEYEGATVLAMPETLAEPLSERTLDVDDRGELVLVPKAS